MGLVLPANGLVQEIALRKNLDREIEATKHNN
jgi:hypothetical protein